MNFSRRTTFPSNNGTNITHNVNLSFEIGTSHISNGETRKNQNAQANTGSGRRAQNEEINGKPEGISHGNNHELRSDYSGNVHHDLGNPHRIRPANDNIARIPEETLGDEAIAQHVKSTGKPNGISQETRMPMIVDPILVDHIHVDVCCHCDTNHINTNEKLFLLMQEWYPLSNHDYNIVNKFEKLAISILKTAIVPSSMPREESVLYSNSLSKINRYRVSEGIPPLPENLLSVKQRMLKPCCFKDLNEHDDDFDAYREGMRIMYVELDVINMIHTGNIPSMNSVQRDRLDTDLKKINEIRLQVDEDELDLNKPLDQYFEDDFPKGRSSQETSAIDTDSSSSDEDDELFGRDEDDASYNFIDLTNNSNEKKPSSILEDRKPAAKTPATQPRYVLFDF